MCVFVRCYNFRALHLRVPHLVYGLVAGILEAEVDHGVLLGPAHVEFQRQVIDALTNTLLF